MCDVRKDQGLKYGKEERMHELTSEEQGNRVAF